MALHIDRRNTLSISVIIPLYNKANAIKATINCVLLQSYKDFELIVVDDGSTDNSFDIASQINDHRVRIIKQANQGVSVARNTGIAKAKYEYVAFLDADDRWSEDFLETICMLIDTYPQASVYATQYQYRYSKNDYESANYCKDFPVGSHGVLNDFFKSSLNDPILCASCIAAKKQALLDVGGFPSGIVRGEDMETWCKLALKYEIAYYNKICATYQRDAKNMATKQARVLENTFASYAEEKYLNNPKYTDESIYFKEYMICRVIEKIYYLTENNKKKDARALIRKYFYSKHLKKSLIRAYILTFVSANTFDKINNIKNKLLGKAK